MREYVQALRAYKTSRSVEKGNYNYPFDKTKDRAYWGSFEEWFADQASRWAVSDAKPVSVVEQFFSKLGKALLNFYRTVKGQGYLPHETFSEFMKNVTKDLDLSPVEGTPEAEAVSAQASINASKKAVDKDLERIQGSPDREGAVEGLGGIITSGEHDAKNYGPLLKDRANNLGDKVFEKLLKVLPGSAVEDSATTMVRDHLRTARRMLDNIESGRNNLLRGSTKLVQDMRNFIDTHGGQVLADTMHLARLKRVDPTVAVAEDGVVKHYQAKLADPKTTPEEAKKFQKALDSRIKDINLVKAQWGALGAQAGGQELYLKTRQYYRDMYVVMRTALNDKINALPIEKAAKDKLMATIRAEEEKARKAAGGAKIDPEDPHSQVPEAAFPAEYFPFLRHGEYWLRVAKGPAGREFHAFTSGAERDAFLRKRAAEIGVSPNDGSTFKIGNSMKEMRSSFQGESNMLKNVFSAVDKVSGKDKADISKLKEELKDQVYQIYLQSRPERSIRKQFLHSDNITGFSSDILTNTKNMAMRYASQLPKLKYAEEAQKALTAARDSLEGMPPRERLKQDIIINEIASRVDNALDPSSPSAVTAFINRFSYLMTLTSGATAITQMTSLPIRVLPNLGAQYGYGKATAALARFAPVWDMVGKVKDEGRGNVSYAGPSAGKMGFVQKDPLLARALERAYETGAVTETPTAMINDLLPTPISVASKDSLNYGTTQALKIMTAMFNASERVSREIAFLAHFQLEFGKNGGKFEAAIETARQGVKDNMGDYSPYERPPVFNGPIGKTVFQFKMYAVNTTRFFLKNAYEIIKKDNSAGNRARALSEVTGVLLMGAMFGGAASLPAYGMVTDAIDLWLDATQSDEEKNERRAQNPITGNSSDAWFRYDYLPSHFGHVTLPGLDGKQHSLSSVLEYGPVSALTGANIGSRTSFNGLWFREGLVGKTWQENMGNMILANLGPSVSVGSNMASAMDDFNDGDIARGLSKLSPAFSRGVIDAIRYSTEGATTRGGEELVGAEELSPIELAATVLGFQPTKIADVQARRIAVMKQELEADNRKSFLMRQLNEAVIEGNVGRMNTIQHQIDQYNAKYPVFAWQITPDKQAESLDAFIRNRVMSYRGTHMDNATEAAIAMPVLTAGHIEQ
jgi:hypothetical protein